jgi:hypothetical protein
MRTGPPSDYAEGSRLKRLRRARGLLPEVALTDRGTTFVCCLANRCLVQCVNGSVRDAAGRRPSA